MLAEMEKFFTWFKSEGVVTNSSTGLHITMSYNPQDGETVNHEEGSSLVTANKVKMAVLLGDQYLLSQWGRDRNTYTKSQLKDLKSAIQNLKREIQKHLHYLLIQALREQTYNLNQSRQINHGKKNLPINCLIPCFKVQKWEHYLR